MYRGIWQQNKRQQKQQIKIKKKGDKDADSFINKNLKIVIQSLQFGILTFIDLQIMMKSQFLIESDSDEGQMWDLPNHNIRRNTHTKPLCHNQSIIQPCQQKDKASQLLIDANIVHLHRLFQSGAAKTLNQDLSQENNSHIYRKQDKEMERQSVSKEVKDEKKQRGTKQYLQQQNNIYKNGQKLVQRSLDNEQIGGKSFQSCLADIEALKNIEKLQSDIQVCQCGQEEAESNKIDENNNSILQRLYPSIQIKNCMAFVQGLEKSKSESQQKMFQLEDQNYSKEEGRCQQAMGQSNGQNCFFSQGNQRSQTFPQISWQLRLGRNKNTKINTQSPFIVYENKNISKQTKALKAGWWMSDKTVIKVKGEAKEGIQLGISDVNLKEKEGKKEIKKKKREKKMESQDVIGQKFSVFLEGLKNRAQRNEKSMHSNRRERLNIGEQNNKRENKKKSEFSSKQCPIIILSDDENEEECSLQGTKLVKINQSEINKLSGSSQSQILK